MSHAALTARYRPQAFAQVAGQDTVKTILSRAALEQRVAPAYLFSGTRGVGKTTLARIFAKALNCRTAPTAEPCNVCDQCKAITTGSAVDVVEIDGASNRGIDDVRRLKEVVGYAPMEGGYKIFIIDEAHMLSREAFNALLKTLEEPPARVVFLLATTEPHKFPATIISRCQHFVFKPLPESALVEHLSGVLRREEVVFEDSALRLIARRGAGSVRDSMSLLGQVLALGEGTLSEAVARNVLGLAGQEAFLGLLDALAAGDSLTLSRLLRDMLDQGLDLGFFLRELSTLWRNLFMLRQSGEAALAVVDLPENEARRYLECSRNFSLQQIHACWQMTLEGQRRVLTSLEPALALELLLLNLGMLPQLLSLEQLSSAMRRGAPPQGGRPGSGSGFHSAPGSGFGPASVPGSGPGSGMSSGMPSPVGIGPDSGPAAGPDLGPAPRADSDPGKNGPSGSLSAGSAEDASEPAAAVFPEAPSRDAAPEDSGEETGTDVENALLPREVSVFPAAAPVSFSEESQTSPPVWERVFTLGEENGQPAWLLSLLRRVRPLDPAAAPVTLVAPDEFTLARLRDPDTLSRLEELLRSWCGYVPDFVLDEHSTRRKSRDDVKAEVMAHPLVREVQSHFGAYIIDYGQMR